MLPAVFCLGLFSVGTATSKNAPSIFLTRFCLCSRQQRLCCFRRYLGTKSTWNSCYFLCGSCCWRTNARPGNWLCTSGKPSSRMALDRVHRSYLGLHNLCSGCFRSSRIIHPSSPRKKSSTFEKGNWKSKLISTE